MVKHLTDAKVHAAKIEDGKYVKDTMVPGLRLELRPGKYGLAKYWAVRVQVNGQRVEIALGSFPKVTLKKARADAVEKRTIAASGIDPRASGLKARAVVAGGETFAYAAEEWIKTNEATWSKGVTANIRGRLKNHVYEHIGDLPLDDIDGAMIIDLLKRLEGSDLKSSKLHTRDKVLEYIQRVFRYGISYRWTNNQPAQISKADVLQKRQGALAAKKFVALEWSQIQKFWHDVDHWTNSTVSVSRGLHPLTSALIKLQILTLSRPGEIRLAEWSEFDLDGAMWTVPNARLKNRNQNPDDHLVPLSSQAVAVLRKLKGLTGHLKHLFPKLVGTGDEFDDSGTLSDGTVRLAARRMGYEVTAHGFRHMASTYLHGLEDEDERGMWDSLWIEYALGHADSNKIRGIYNNAKYLKPRSRMLQFYADQIVSDQTPA
tara:strand:+ start:1253 stop:2545 length:1293 start_codon:yes stop_codon:yes gene_type:complete